MNIFGFGKSNGEPLPDQKFCKGCGAALGTAENAQSVAVVAAKIAEAAPPPLASTHDIPVGGLTIEDIVAWLQGAGYSAKVVTADNGKRHIVSNTQGSPLNVLMADCNGECCASIELATGFSTHGKFDISQLNEWNSNNNWCRAYYDSTNDPWLEMDINLSPGGTYESLNDQFATWNKALALFINKYSLR